MHTDNIDQHAAAGSVVVKVINYIAASMGIGTFLGVVNVAVGVLSAAWLAMQLYGYIKHELPMKRMRQQMLRRELDRTVTRPAPLGDDE